MKASNNNEGFSWVPLERLALSFSSWNLFSLKAWWRIAAPNKNKNVHIDPISQACWEKHTNGCILVKRTHEQRTIIAGFLVLDWPGSSIRFEDKLSINSFKFTTSCSRYNKHISPLNNIRCSGLQRIICPTRIFEFIWRRFKHVRKIQAPRKLKKKHVIVSFTISI